MSSITLDDLVNEAVDVYEKRKNGDKDAAYEQVDVHFDNNSEQELTDEEVELWKKFEELCPTTLATEEDFIELRDALHRHGFNTHGVSRDDIHDAMIRAGINTTPPPDESHDYHYEPPYMPNIPDEALWIGDLNYHYWRPTYTASSGATYADMYNAVRAITPEQVMRYAT